VLNLKREYAIDNAIVEEFIENEDEILSSINEEIQGNIYSSNKCLIINLKDYSSEVILYNLSEKELEKAKDIVNKL